MIVKERKVSAYYSTIYNWIFTQKNKLIRVAKDNSNQK